MSSVAKWDPVVFMTTIAGTSQTLSESRPPLYNNEQAQRSKLLVTTKGWYLPTYTF